MITMSNYNNYAYAIARCSMAEFVAQINALIGAIDNFTRAVLRDRTQCRQAQRLLQRRTIGKEHRGYAKSRLRIHQRRG